jgi:hypothetical protein
MTNAIHSNLAEGLSQSKPLREVPKETTANGGLSPVLWRI